MKVENIMFQTGRRSAISSSELGLYSDRFDYYNRNNYGQVIKKFVIGVMAVVAVILAAIFIYDFASGATTASKVSQETKHVYILQNSIKKPSYLTKKSTTISPLPQSQKLTSLAIEDRSDVDENLSYIDLSPTVNNDNKNFYEDNLEMKSQNLSNFKLRQKFLNSQNKEEEEADEDKIESKQLIKNHAVMYRVRQMYKHPDFKESLNRQEFRPKPFHFELKTPHPSSFKKIKYPQLSQYRYPHTSRNIQDIIKYLIKDPTSTKHGIKFTGVYVNPKKYDLYSDISEIIHNDQTEQSDEVNSTEEEEDEEEEEEEVDTSHITVTHHDPFYQYKPKHPSDINFLAPANVRYSSGNINRYNPYIEHPYFHRPVVLTSKPVINNEPIYDSTGAYSGSYGKKKKPKPFSVMLDIYPITDLNDQVSTKITSKPKPAIGVPLTGPTSEESIQDSRYHHSHYRPDFKRPLIPIYKRGARYHSTPIPIVAIPASQSGLPEEDEKKQMIFHLNLYPRRKSKSSRYDILKRSERMHDDEQKEFIKKVMSPLEILTKQLIDQSALEQSKFVETDAFNTSELTRYHESFVEMPNEYTKEEMENNSLKIEVPKNHRNMEITSKNISRTDLPITRYPESPNNMTQQVTLTSNLEDCSKNTTMLDVDTIEGFQKFADGLVSAT
ncbi:uncharacterized protein [Chelonus insularis]|uniref:uncharacterized protein n=1 Tax=Chelonus insularis TaxID=460826 RepID=UPI00158B7330|nr:uncharacterized protein LOC118072925 [Chelonus insularis]